MYKEIEGDLIELALKGEFDCIAHGCNCMSTMGAGIAIQMAKVFGCDLFPMELESIGIHKLGNIDANIIARQDNKHLIVVNAYTQYSYSKNHKDGTKNPVDYEAIALCMRKINHTFKGKTLGLPKIGSGLAGGDWEIIKGVIQKECTDIDVTVVIYK